MKIKNIVIVGFLSIAILSGCSDKDTISEDDIVKTAESKKVEAKAPEFNLQTHDGKSLKIVANKEGWRFEGFENKAILLNFFGTWCPPCKAEIPHLNNIREKLKNDFEIIAVDVGKRGGGTNTVAEVEDFIKEFSVSYPIVLGAENGKIFGAVSELNPQGSIPFMILFNPKGEYVQYYIGMKPEEMLFSDISKAIKMK
ncbi:MAG: redoxin family protein [Campylobacterota bacterium]|nr:redoxin family protein [Campylobacterota bacterium]